MIFLGTPEIVREMVTVAHFDLEVVQELLEARPSLPRAAWGWGFGDWKTASGAGWMRCVLPINVPRLFVYCSTFAMLPSSETMRHFVISAGRSNRSAIFLLNARTWPDLACAPRSEACFQFS